MALHDTIARKTFDAAKLFAAHPPALRDKNKAAVLSLAVTGAAPSGELTVSRHRVGTIPEAIETPPCRLEIRPDVFSYPLAGEWHVNFADPFLFFAYGSRAFAQDEIQVAEHPILGSVREALLGDPIPGLEPRTLTDAGESTPILVANAERHCSINLAGIYGNAFFRASSAAISGAVAPLRPPTRSNIVAMAAPRDGVGVYKREHIEEIVSTAACAFSAVRAEGGSVIHTGHWGTGAFGGDRTLMACLQILAARLASIDRLVYHTVDRAGEAPVIAARTLIDSLSSITTLSDLLDEIEWKNFRWGVSDGN